MSLRITNNVQSHCTRVREFCFELEWIPEKNYVAGSHIELRSDRLRTFVSWRYTRMDMDGADVVWRWPVRASISDRIKNPKRVLMRAHLQYSARKGVPMRIRIQAIPALWAGIDESLSVWTQEVPNNFVPDAPQPEPVE